jgi:ADP-ribose pyrophosphatase YjhB (NUDIX family)
MGDRGDARGGSAPARRTIKLEDGGYWFSLRTAAVVRDEDRVLPHRGEADDFWSLPGGTFEFGEPSGVALRREMREELDVDVVVGRLLFVVENFFERHGGPWHEVGLFHAVALPEGATVLDRTRDHDGREDNGLRLWFRWFGIAALADVPLSPVFLRTALGGDGSVPDMWSRSIRPGRGRGQRSDA